MRTDAHVDGCAVGVVGTDDVETLVGVTVRVNAVTARARTSTTATGLVIPGSGQHTGVGGGVGSTSPGEVVEETVGEVETAVWASGALKQVSVVLTFHSQVTDHVDDGSRGSLSPGGDGDLVPTLRAVVLLYNAIVSACYRWKQARNTHFVVQGNNELSILVDAAACAVTDRRVVVGKPGVLVVALGDRNRVRRAVEAEGRGERGADEGECKSNSGGTHV